MQVLPQVVAIVFRCSEQVYTCTGSIFDFDKNLQMAENREFFDETQTFPRIHLHMREFSSQRIRATLFVLEAWTSDKERNAIRL